MPFPIGVSGGDFVACLQLIRTVAKAVKDSSGASEHFRTLVNTLARMETILSFIDELEVSEVRHLVALKTAAVQCQATVQAFLDRIEKYQPRLEACGSGNALADAVRRVQWVLLKKEDVAQLQAEISGHAESLNLLLNIVLFAAHKKAQTDLNTRLTNVESRIAEQASAQHLMSARLSQCVTEAARVRRAVLTSTLAIFNGLMRLAHTSQAVPQQMPMGTAATLVDPFGQSISVPLQFVGDWKTFGDVMQQHLLKASGRSRKPGRAQYVLRYASTGQKVPVSAYESVFKPNNTILMSLLLMYDFDAAERCPGCRGADPEPDNETYRCECGMVYTRTQDPIGANYVVTLPSHFYPMAEQSCPCVQGSVYEEPEHEPDCQSRLHSQDDGTSDVEFEGGTDILAMYGSLKRLDFSVAPGVMITDTFNFHHLVQWPLARSLEGVRFFRRWFTAFGALLDWPFDVAMQQQDGQVLDESNWVLKILPGAAVQIIFAEVSAEAWSQGSLLQDNLTHFIKRHGWLLEHRTPGIMLRDLYSLLGPGTGHRDLRLLVRSTAWSLWLQHQRCGQAEARSTRDRTREMCLMCNIGFADVLQLSKHMHCHHRYLHCQAQCSQCDADGLPWFATERPTASDQSEAAALAP